MDKESYLTKREELIRLSKFRKAFEISYYETNKDKSLRPISLLNLLGETSGDHSNSTI